MMDISDKVHAIEPGGYWGKYRNASGHRINVIDTFDPHGMPGWVLDVHTTGSGDITIALPPEVMQYQHDIRRFVEAMVYKLVKHSSKGRWEKIDGHKALDLLGGEVTELREAIERGNMVEILLEAADVANYGLIISAIAMERGK